MRIGSIGFYFHGGLFLFLLLFRFLTIFVSILSISNSFVSFSFMYILSFCISFIQLYARPICSDLCKLCLCLHYLYTCVYSVWCFWWLLLIDILLLRVIKHTCAKWGSLWNSFKTPASLAKFLAGFFTPLPLRRPCLCRSMLTISILLFSMFVVPKVINCSYCQNCRIALATNTIW